MAAALVSYTGTSNGSVTADGLGNYTIGGLVAGAYTLTPSLVGYTFVPTDQVVTLTTASMTGIDFTADANATTPPISSIMATDEPSIRVADAPFMGTSRILGALIR